tara:strand:- start:12674 stop:13405 length:732 start_codon:yes stop_codon:yes gene_type:complete
MITLYQFRHSAFCLKTRMALHAKKLVYRVEEVKPGIGQIEIFKISGQKQLPVIMDDNNQIISDSTNICEYIDKKNGNNPLYPNDPMHFSQSKLIEDWADTTMATVCKKALIKSALENPKLRVALLPEDIPASIKNIFNKLPLNNLNKISNVILSDKSNIEFQKILESLSKSLINKKFLIGNQLSIADISVASQLSLLKFSSSAGPNLAGEGCQEFINNPYLENLFQWRDGIEEYLFSASSQDV